MSMKVATFEQMSRKDLFFSVAREVALLAKGKLRSGLACARAYGSAERSLFFNLPGTCPSARVARLGTVPGYYRSSR
jgi:hypothetical protein